MFGADGATLSWGLKEVRFEVGQTGHVMPASPLTRWVWSNRTWVEVPSAKRVESEAGSFFSPVHNFWLDCAEAQRDQTTANGSEPATKRFKGC